MLGWIKKVVVGRWLARWLLRGGPWSVAAKLLLVAVWSAWRWRRSREVEAGSGGPGEIPADYEVLETEGPGRETPGKEPASGPRGSETGATEPERAPRTNADPASDTRRSEIRPLPDEEDE